MKKILLLSDTHGTIDEWMLGHAAEADQIWHAGDIGDLAVTEALEEHALLRAVWGNIDGDRIRKSFPEHQIFNLYGKRIWITHIGGYPGRYDRRVREAIRRQPPDVFICGHSHILKVMPDKKLNLLHMNPGAVGRHGFHKKRTMLKFNIDVGGLSDLMVIEKDR